MVGVVEFTVNDDAVKVFAGKEGAAMGKECVVEVGFAMWIGVGVGSKWEAVADGDELGIGSRGCGRISDGDSGGDSGTSTWGWGWGA